MNKQITKMELHFLRILFIVLSVKMCAGETENIFHDHEYMLDTFNEMDKNGDQKIDLEDELKPWLMKIFEKIDTFKSTEEFLDMDTNSDKYISWEEMVYGTLRKSLEDLAAITDDNETAGQQEVLKYTQNKWKICDKNQDNKLSKNEYFYFINSHMYLPHFETEQILLNYDKNRDNKVTLEEIHEYFSGGDGQIHHQSDEEFLKEKDINKDGYLDFNELRFMVKLHPDQETETYSKTIMTVADENHDGKLNKVEFGIAETEIEVFKDVERLEAPEAKDDDIPGAPVEPETTLDIAKLLKESPSIHHEEKIQYHFLDEL